MATRRRYRSALRSEKLLREAFIKLTERGERMNVTALCREADLNRSTFYAHYDSIDALQEELVSNLMQDLGRVVQGCVGPEFERSPESVIDAIGSYVAANRTLFRLLITSSQSFGFGDDLRSVLLDAVGCSGIVDEMRFDYVAGGLASIYRTWILGQYGDIPIEKANQIAAALVRVTG